MELIELPKPMRNRGFVGWPEVYRVGEDEELPPVGVSYIIAEKVDFALVFRLMIPLLEKQHGYFDWPEVYKSIVGEVYYPQRVYQQREVEGRMNEGHSYGAPVLAQCDVTLEQLASDRATYVDLDVLTQLAMIPAFMSDIRDAITVNVTNNYQWTDGFDKKRGVCSGYLTEAPRAKSLVILDISGSIPDGVSAGMMTLIKTITEVCHADLIITGGQSLFFAHEDVRTMNIREVRRRVSRANEGEMFYEILRTHDMDYENIITFGDSDNPGQYVHNGVPPLRTSTKRWYSFFCMPADQYGNHYKMGCGYGRWIVQANPAVEIIHHTNWAKFFKKEQPGSGRRW